MLTIVDCPQWSDGKCKAGKFGGKPSPGICVNVCEVRANVTHREMDAATWDELHRYALAYSGDRVEALRWLSDFASRVPSVGCSCRSHFTKLLRDNPPDLTNADTFFASTYLWHDAVSARIGKPRISIEQARPLYT